MIKYYLYTAASLLLLTLTGCSKENIEIQETPYTTRSILTLAHEQQWEAANIGSLDASKYNPVSVCHSGDTLFIANRADGADGILVVRASTGELLKSLTEWTYNGETEKFDNQIIDVAVNADYIFVVNRSSRIDMFNRKDYSYITTIGRTGWQSSSLLQCESMEIAGDKLFIRDKRRVKVVQIADCTPENRFKIPIFAESRDSTTENTGFQLETVVGHNQLIYVSDYRTSKILVIDPATVTEKGAPVSFIRSYTMINKPLSMDFYKDEMFVVCDNKTIVRMDLTTGETIATYTAFAGGKSWDNPGRLCFSGETFYLTGRNTPGFLQQGKVMYIEISEID